MGIERRTLGRSLGRSISEFKKGLRDKNESEPGEEGDDAHVHDDVLASDVGEAVEPHPLGNTNVNDLAPCNSGSGLLFYVLFSLPRKNPISRLTFDHKGNSDLSVWWPALERAVFR